MLVTREEGEWRREDEEGNRGQIYGDRRNLDFGSWAHNAIDRCCIMDLYA